MCPMVCLVAWLALLLVVPKGSSVAAIRVEEAIRLPRGFQIHSYTNGSVPEARSLALSTSRKHNGTLLYVSTRTRSHVYAVIDADGDGVAERVVTVIKNQESPNGIAWHHGSLYVATPEKILRYDKVDSRALAGKRFRKPVVIRDDFEAGWAHYWRYIGFSPDDELYLALGIDCNICNPQAYGEVVDGTLLRMQPNGTGLEIFATGVRNSVGFDWHPWTGEFFFTENGADGMGNNRPDDVLYRAPKAGMDFGFPKCHIKGIGSPYRRWVGRHFFFANSGPHRKCRMRSQVRPVQPLGPHVAALGMRFYTGDMFPKRYKNSIFIAEHGSWNRDSKIGFRVVNVRLGMDNKTAIKHRMFAKGWVAGGVTLGRPVDIQELPDGSLLVSDDFTDDIYRITYRRRSRSTQTS